jgi:flavin reductase (DIM6/NTAB) family NADH-FMN oxidoreductase RutF/rubredoxin
MDSTALFKFSSGLYIVSATDGKRTGACIINTGLQLTSDPLQVEVVVNKQNHTCDVIGEAGHFALSVVSERADMPFIGTFGFKSSADIDKFAGLPTETTDMFDPYTTENTCAVISCAVAQTIDVGTHLIFVGEVTDARNLSDDAPMTYSYYHTVLRGKTPPKASAFVPGEDATKGARPAKAAGPLHHFRCMVCGYVHETPDEELPADFRCPLCGFGPEKFERID